MDIRGALRILSSSSGLAEVNDETYVRLQGKHPPVPENCQIPEPPDEASVALHSEEEVIQALISFPPGNAAGTDALRPAHLKDIIGPKTGEAGADLRRALTRLANTITRADLPDFMTDTIFGASLCALNKGGGDVRPIAVGCTYRRLAVKVALRPLTESLGDHFAPVQLGFGTRGGCEAAAHAARTYLKNLREDEVVVKLDMSNAFNSVNRGHFLSVIKKMSSLFPLLNGVVYYTV